MNFSSGLPVTGSPIFCHISGRSKKIKKSVSIPGEGGGGGGERVLKVGSKVWVSVRR